MSWEKTNPVIEPKRPDRGAQASFVLATTTAQQKVKPQTDKPK